MRLYLSGPITGIALNNAPAFNCAAAMLRAKGYQVTNPIELDSMDLQPMQWSDYMRRDIPELLACDGVALLEGWEKSKGARLEHHIAVELGMRVQTVKEWQ